MANTIELMMHISRTVVHCMNLCHYDYGIQYLNIQKAKKFRFAVISTVLIILMF